MGFQKEIFLEDVTLAWTWLDEKDKNGKYRATAMLDKNNKEHARMREEVLDAIDAVVEDGVKNLSDWKGKEPSSDNIMKVQNGDKTDYDFQYDRWLIAASSKNEVPCVLENRMPSKDIKRDFYPGVRANMIFRIYQLEGANRGVYFSLEAIQKVADGKRISTGGQGGVDPQKAFKDVSRGGGRDRDDRGRDDDDRGSRGRDRDDDRGSRRRDDDDDRGRGRGRDDDDDRGRSRDRERDDDRGRGRRDDDDRGSRRDDRDDRGRRDDRDDDRGRGRRDDDDRGSRRRDEDDDRGSRRRDDDDRGSRRNDRDREDDYDRGRERGRDKF